MLEKCPNRASKEWKLLVSQMNGNEDNAWLLWKANGYSFPKALQTTAQIKRAVGVRKEMSNLQVALMAKRLAKYNDKFSTSHSFKANKIGQADLYTVDLTVSYWPKRVMTQVVASKDYSIVGNRVVKDFINSNPNFYYKEGNEYVRGGEVYPSYEDMVDYLPATIKPGVSELFESNPELANQVYEALGFIPEKLSYQQISDVLYRTSEYRASLFPNLKSLYTNSARLKGFNISPEKASINFLNNILKEAKKGEELRGSYDQIEELIEEAIDNIYKESYGRATELGERALSLLHDGVSREIIREGIENISENSILITPQQKQQAQQLYSQYLDTIFPDSQMKDIVYHNTKEQFETFDKSKLISDGFYFTPDSKAYKHAGNFKMLVLLNLKNPITDAPGLSETINKPGDTKRFSDLGYDGIADLDGLNEYIVFEPEQIHILGSKQDIENFANFVAYENSDFSKIGNINQFRDYIISKNFAAIEEFLVVNNKIDRKC